MLLLEQRVSLLFLFKLLFQQRIQLAAQLGAFFCQLFNLALEGLAAGLIHAGRQRPIFGDGRVFAGAAERARRAGLQARALLFQADNPRFQLANGFHIAELLIFLFISLAPLGERRFQLLLLLAAGLLRRLQLAEALAQGQQAAVQGCQLLTLRAGGGVAGEVVAYLVGIQRQRRRRQFAEPTAGLRQPLLQPGLLLRVARLLLERRPPACQGIAPLAIAVVGLQPLGERLLGLLQLARLLLRRETNACPQPQPIV
nr:Uncharacterised protein [Raoultella sp. NCTC 9187]